MRRLIKAILLLATAAVFFVWFMIGKVIGYIVSAPFRFYDDMLFASYVDVSYKVAMRDRPTSMMTRNEEEFRKDALAARELYRDIQKKVWKGKYQLWKPIFSARESFVQQCGAERDFCRLWMPFYYYVDDMNGFERFAKHFHESVLTFEFLYAVRDYVEKGMSFGDLHDEWMKRDLSHHERVSSFIWSIQTLNFHVHAIYRSHPTILESRPTVATIIELYSNVKNIHRMAEFVIARVDAGIPEKVAKAEFFEQEGVYG